MKPGREGNAMKTKEELNAIKEEVKEVNKKLAELTEDELISITGGLIVRNPDGSPYGVNPEELLEELKKDGSLDRIYAQEDTLIPVICSCGTFNLVSQKSHAPVCSKCGQLLWI